MGTICGAYVNRLPIRSVAAGAVAKPTRPVGSPADVPGPVPAFGEAKPGTFLAALDRAHAERQAKLKAARAARRKATEARALAMSRVIAVGRPETRTAVAVLRPLRAGRTRRESPARTVGRGGDSGDSSDSDESEPPGVAPGGDLRHVSGVLKQYLSGLPP